MSVGSCLSIEKRFFSEVLILGLRLGQHKKYRRAVGRIFFLFLKVGILERKKNFFSKQRRKTSNFSTVSVQSFYYLCNKIEEHP